MPGHLVGCFVALCIEHFPGMYLKVFQNAHIMDRPSSLHNTVSDDEVSMAHKLDVDALHM